MRLFADAFVNGAYKKLTAYRIKEDLENGIDFWKDKVFLSTHKHRENKDVLVFVNGEMPYFDGGKKATEGPYIENVYEQVNHEIFKEALADLTEYNLNINGEKIAIYVDRIEIDSYVIIEDEYISTDLTIGFSKSTPEEYTSKWGGRLSVRIFVNPTISEMEREKFEKVNLALFEPKIQLEHRLFRDGNQKINNKDIRVLYEKIKRDLCVGIEGNLLVDPEAHIEKKTQIEKIRQLIEGNAHKRTQIEDLSFKLHQKNMTIRSLEKKLDSQSKQIKKLEQFLNENNKFVTEWIHDK